MAMENREYPVPRTCPHCGNTGAELMPPVGDYSEYRCPECRTYRISDTMETLIENGQVDPVAAHIEEQGGHRWLVE
jgi:tRNA(Ile2) C34 agmatinyltransferase TiaS